MTFTFGSKYSLRECQTCGVSYYFPQLGIPELQTFYSTHGYEFNLNSQAARAKRIANNYLHQRPVGRFLDVGCATGFLLDGIKNEVGWDVHGVELVEKAASFASGTLGLKDVLNKDLQQAGYPSAFFDVVHVSEVLEHVPDPISMLEECRRIIKPDGLFFLSLPNGCADRQGLIDYWNIHRIPPGHASGHIYFFSAKGLRDAVRAAGFKIVSTHTYAFKQGLRSLRLFPRRRGWAGMFSPRTETEKPNNSEIGFTLNKHSKRFYQIKYGLRERLKIPGLWRVGLGWHLVLEPTSD